MMKEKCNYQDKNGRHIEMVGGFNCSMSSKTAAIGTRIPIQLVATFANALMKTYDCEISTLFHTDGFNYVFIKPPIQDMRFESQPVIITRNEIESVTRKQLNPDAIPIITLLDYFTFTQLDILRWILDALVAQSHTWKVRDNDITWSPPRKSPQYTKLLKK